jgi:apolipoprotein N-acyltransferase
VRIPARDLRLALAGALGVLGFAPFGAFPLALLACAYLFWHWRDAATPGVAARMGFAFGSGFFLCGVSWVYVSLQEFGGMPVPLALAATLLFCLYLALYVALAGYLSARLCAPGGLRLALAACAWVIAEWLRSLPVNGFPWIDLGYSQIDTPLAGYAPLFGVYGMSLLGALVAALLAGLLRPGTGARILPRINPQGRRSAVLVLLIVAVFALGGVLRTRAWTEAAGAPLPVALVQGNVPQELKFVPGRLEQTLATYARLLEGTQARLAVLPETAVPRFFHEVDPRYWTRLRAIALRNAGDILVGVPTGNPEQDYFNSVISLGASPTQVYSKTHLVPLGEFIPAGFQWIMAYLDIPMSAFSPGPPGQRPLAVAGQKVAINICYEDVFGAEIARQLPEATLLANTSNVAWFGHSLAPAQHLQMSRLRAIETGRDLVRATNTGMTAIVHRDGSSRVLESFREGVLTGEVQGYSGSTPYVIWTDAPALLAAAAGMLLLAILGRRGAQQRAQAQRESR